MKEYIGNSVNIFALVHGDGSVTPEAELILILSEPSYRLAAGGGVLRERETESVRFILSEGACGQLIESLEEVKAELTKTSETVQNFHEGTVQA